MFGNPIIHCLICKIKIANEEGICEDCDLEMTQQLEVLEGMPDEELRAELHAEGIDFEKDAARLRAHIESVIFGVTKKGKTDD